MSRRGYWTQPIAFDCPVTKTRPLINDCFCKCADSDYDYLNVNGVVSGYMYCPLTQRYLHDGCQRRKV